MSLAKGRHRYVFWYREGQESSLLASLVQLAEATDTNFDWLDAAVLSYQMGKGIGNTADRQVAVSP
ncbi:MAG: hypothetical protein ACE5I3_07545 [Phycisphaerae bacterium]